MTLLQFCSKYSSFQNDEKKIHNARKIRYRCYVVFFSKNLHNSLDAIICNSRNSDLSGSD